MVHTCQRGPGCLVLEAVKGVGRRNLFSINLNLLGKPSCEPG